MLYLLSTVASMSVMKRFALFYLLVLGVVSTEAATYYVRPGGSDSHSCSQAQTDTNANAKGTIQGGVNCVQGAGDTVIVHAGTYLVDGDPNNEVILPGRSGTNWGSGAITLKAAPGETVWQLGGLNGWTDHAAWWVIDGIHVDGQYRGDSSRNGLLLPPNSRLLNAEVKNARHIGILVADTGRAEFINVRSHGRGKTAAGYCASNPAEQGGQCHGLYLHPGAETLVEGGEYYDNAGFGIHTVFSSGGPTTIRGVKAYGNEMSGLIFVGQSGTHYIFNNLFYNNNNNGLEAYSGTNFIYNNTIYGNGSGGIRGIGSEDEARNNIIYANPDGAFTESSSPTLSHNLTGNPSFANASAGDFHLQAGSLAIDAGATITGVTTDFDKTPRPQGADVDIGAYEYRASAPRPLNAPTLYRIAGQ